ncbi:hypothetical protein BDV96DRAFT_183389 [Lophiotrema nucula]|uniref:Uncharacterized protein n=1 Tax=Lophiotrema nucula TaxID=690887 RepID=A0A6A5YX14_9PLEO|nr:hypothetical protein BDV96DRAFT_183389 [Lophiotrema nucula]
MMVNLVALLISIAATVPSVAACSFTMQIRQECIAAHGGGVVPVTYASIDGNQEVSLERDRDDIWPGTYLTQLSYILSYKCDSMGDIANMMFVAGHPLTVHPYFPKSFASFTYGSCNFDEQASTENCGSCKTTSAWAPGDWKCELPNPSQGSRVGFCIKRLFVKELTSL